jgi:hypothetical protein
MRVSLVAGLRSALAGAAACTLIGVTDVNASPYVVTLNEVGSNVVATGSGQLDFSGLSFAGNLFINAGLVPNIGTVSIASANVDEYTGTISGPASFGSGTQILATSSSGNPAYVWIGGYLLVPVGYVSDTDLGISTSTYVGKNFASLGVTPGTYTWTWGTAPDQSYTLAIGATPLPAALPIFASGLGVFGLLGWRRKRKAKLAA